MLLTYGLFIVMFSTTIIRNKIVIKVGILQVLNVSFIYDKTSPSKGGVIGTMYPNSSFSTYRIIIFSRSSPRDPMGTLVKECAWLPVLCAPIKHQ